MSGLLQSILLATLVVTLCNLRVAVATLVCVLVFIPVNIGIMVALEFADLFLSDEARASVADVGNAWCDWWIRASGAILGQKP